MFNRDNNSINVIARLGVLLKKHSFFQRAAEERLQYKFGDWKTAFIPTFFFPLVYSRLQLNNPLDILLLFFYCGYPILFKHINGVLGKELVEDLCKINFIVKYNDSAEAMVQIIPFNDLMIVTEPPRKNSVGVKAINFSRDAVMTLFPDSYDLAKNISGKKANLALDFFCGNGIQSLVLAKSVKHVIGVDINPKAIYYAKINSVINEINNVEFQCYDVTKPVDYLGKGAFDLLVANPPFCPAPEQKTLFSDGGPFGDYFVKLLISERLPEVAAAGASAYIIFPLALKNGESVEKKVKLYQSDILEYQESFININATTARYDFLVYYLASQYIDDLPRYNQEMARYCKHMKDIGIEKMVYFVLFLSNIHLKT